MRTFHRYSATSISLSYILLAAFVCLNGWPVKAVAQTREGGTLSKTKSVDLRPSFERWRLEARRQGSRATCSAFTMAGAIEYAAAKHQGRGSRFSVEFLNWASNATCGDHDDGGFFSDLWKGFANYGICDEGKLPYSSKYDPDLQPGESVLRDAKRKKELGLHLHWIKEWNVKTGLTDQEFKAIQRTLRRGWPVCGGFRWPKQEQWVDGVLQMCPASAVYDGHSVLLVGYRAADQEVKDGVFIFRNTAGDGKDGMMTYTYAKAYMNDAAWVD
jgi:hypothetical protein